MVHDEMIRPWPKRQGWFYDRRKLIWGGCLIFWALVFLFALATASAAPEQASFFVVQISDPQFGLEHANARWQEEQAMLNETIRLINRLAPRLVVITGDLQNFLPTPAGAAWPMAAQSGHLGAEQVASVKQSLSLLDSSIPIRATIPGNHDLGYAPTVDTLDAFERNWGGDHTAFSEGGVDFIAIDSQLYFDSTQPGVAQRKEEQTARLSAELVASAERGAAGAVLLSHIPPFVVGASESSGWANWPSEVREEVLSASQQRGMEQPGSMALSLVISGHFHANVDGVFTAAFGAPMEVVTTSSCGCPFLWNGSDANVAALPHTLASAIASEATGYDAWQSYIVRNGTALGNADESLVAARVSAGSDRSGVRLFEFSAAHGYRHGWWTLERLQQLGTPLGSMASPFAHLPFTPWTSRRQATVDGVG
jgi:3',5'-cyclic AMP phosphodiesterase CpdA